MLGMVYSAFLTCFPSSYGWLGILDDKCLSLIYNLFMFRHPPSSKGKVVSLPHVLMAICLRAFMDYEILESNNRLKFI